MFVILLWRCSVPTHLDTHPRLPERTGIPWSLRTITETMVLQQPRSRVWPSRTRARSSRRLQLTGAPARVAATIAAAPIRPVSARFICGTHTSGRAPTAAGSPGWPDRAGTPDWTSSRPSRRPYGRSCRRDMSGRRSSRTSRIRHRHRGSSQGPTALGRAGAGRATTAAMPRAARPPMMSFFTRSPPQRCCRPRTAPTAPSSPLLR